MCHEDLAHFYTIKTTSVFLKSLSKNSAPPSFLIHGISPTEPLHTPSQVPKFLRQVKKLLVQGADPSFL